MSISITYAKNNDGGKNKSSINSLFKPTTDPAVSVVDINSITSYVQNDGFHPYVINGGSWNGEYPKGSNLGAIFTEGICWGGKVNDGLPQIVRVGGSNYTSGNIKITRLFRVRPDFKTADLTDDVASFFQETAGSVTSAQIQTVQTQYQSDWNSWPTANGAPWYGPDLAKGLPYNPTVDSAGVKGASQTLFINYNDANAQGLFASTPIGMQVSETYWAYSSIGPLSNVIYKRVQLIYTGTTDSQSNSTIDSMYIAQFADPDVGQYSDDYAGCKPSINLGFAYNSSPHDALYSVQGYAPPAIGYVFLQSAAYKTGDPNDSAIVSFKSKGGNANHEVKGYKYFSNTPMSGFVYFAAGGIWSDPPAVGNSAFNYTNSSLGMYNLMRGYQEDATNNFHYPENIPFPRPDRFGGPVGGAGTYLLDGDPVTGSGWIDGLVEGAGDRRILCINGPISMKLNDTVEVVIALVGGMGSNNISSVSTLEYNTQFAQYLYSNFFAKAFIDQPSVTKAELDGEVVLNWGDNPALINSIENNNGPKLGYDFQGYFVYQVPPSARALDKAVLIRAFDLKDGVQVLSENVQDPVTGLIYLKPITILKNLGIQRYTTVTFDTILAKPLKNGQLYTFAVTAFGYNASNGLPQHILESNPFYIDVTPHASNPGVRVPVNPGDALSFARTAGASDGVVVAKVIDPTKVAGQHYKVTFKKDPSDSTGNTLLWTLYNGSNIVLDNQKNLSADNTYIIVNGLQIKVSGPTKVGIKLDDSYSTADSSAWGWWIPKGTRRFTPSGGDPGNLYGLPEFGPNLGYAYGTLGYESIRHLLGDGTQLVSGADLKKVKLILAKVDFTGDFDPPIDVTDPNVSYGYRWVRNSQNPPADPSFKFTAGPTYGFQDYNQSVPLSAWDMTDPVHPKRLALGFFENNVAGGLVDGKYWPGNNAIVTDNSSGTSPKEWLFIFDEPYTGANADTKYEVDVRKTDARMMYWALWNRRNNYLAWSPGGSGADEFEISPYKPLTVNDVFEITVPAVITDPNLAKNDVKSITVFPNPYYGYNSRETSRAGKYVTFSHLPDNCTIRIFDLAGVLVRNLPHSATSSSNAQFENWDLRNNNNYPVASGVYVAYIENMSTNGNSLGTTKILKLAIIQEEQILRVY